MKENHLDESAFSFNATYEQNERLFGHPYRELQEFFKGRGVKGTALDLGCGQGRDALFLASLGYRVTAIDNSEVGVNQMLKRAKAAGLEIKGIVADVLQFETEEKFDIILFDMLLHSFEKSQQSEILNKHSEYLSDNGIMCIVYPDDMNAEHFLEILHSLNPNWKLIEKITIRDVPKMENEESDFTFEMLIAQRVN